MRQSKIDKIVKQLEYQIAKRVNEKVEQIFEFQDWGKRNDLYKEALEDFNKRIESEVFIDEIIKRIKRKQLK